MTRIFVSCVSRSGCPCLGQRSTGNCGSELNNHLPGLTNFLVSGFTYGFSINCEGLPALNEQKNLASAVAHAKVVDKKLAKELDAHQLAGPFKSPPFPNFCVFLLDVFFQKKVGQFR